MRKVLEKIGILAKKEPKSRFSEFVQNAPAKEKKAFFLDVARKASADQRKIMGYTR